MNKKERSFAEKMSPFEMGNLSLLLYDPTVDGATVTWGKMESLASKWKTSTNSKSLSKSSDAKLLCR